MYQLVKDLQFREEKPIPFPSSFVDEYQAENFEANVIDGEYAPTELIIKRLKESGVWELGDDPYPGAWDAIKWWATVKIKDGTLVRARKGESRNDRFNINIILIVDEMTDGYGRVTVSYTDIDNADWEDSYGEEMEQLGKELTILFKNNGMFQSDDFLEYGDMGEFYHVHWGDLVRHDCAANADLDIYEDDVITMECNTCGRTALFRQETPYDGPRNAENFGAESFEANYSCSDCVNKRNYEAESVLEQVKTADSLDSASKLLRAYSGDGMVADNMKYLDSIISYDYGSNQNAEYEIYGAPTVADVQKFAEGLLNIHRFLGE